MDIQPLFDLSPLARLMLVGIVLALIPMAWVGWRNRQTSADQSRPVKRLHALTLLTLVLTFDLVLFGAFTRLTDSGLGCPDWPGCYGSASPLGAQTHIEIAQTAMPTGPVTTSKAWIEMVHRYMATAVGVLLTVLAVASWLSRDRKQGNSGHHVNRHWWATATLVWVCVQGAFGALTVTMKLFPAIVTLHLLGALVLLALLTVQGVQQSSVGRFSMDGAPLGSIASGHPVLVGVAMVALVLQIALGGWVSTNYAVLACNEFPQCQGSWWPRMNFEQGFELWRHLGQTASGENISFEALTAIHYAHRMMAVVVVVVLAALALVLNTQAGSRSASRWIAGLIGLQLATGLSNVVLDWPLLAALLHTGGAAALVIVLTWVACSRREPSLHDVAAAEKPPVLSLHP